MGQAGEAARYMPPVIWTIVMLGLLARRRFGSMSGFFTTRWHRQLALAYWRRKEPRQGFLRSGSAGFGRSQKDGLPSCRAEIAFGPRPLTRAQSSRCPFLIGSGNGRRAWPCSTRRAVTPLRSLRLGRGRWCCWLAFLCVRYNRDSRRSRAAAL